MTNPESDSQFQTEPALKPTPRDLAVRDQPFREQLRIEVNSLTKWEGELSRLEFNGFSIACSLLAKGLDRTLYRAVEVYQEDPKVFRDLVAQCAEQFFSNATTKTGAWDFKPRGGLQFYSLGVLLYAADDLKGLSFRLDQYGLFKASDYARHQSAAFERLAKAIRRSPFRTSYEVRGYTPR